MTILYLTGCLPLNVITLFFFVDRVKLYSLTILTNMYTTVHRFSSFSDYITWLSANETVLSFNICFKITWLGILFWIFQLVYLSSIKYNYIFSNPFLQKSSSKESWSLATLWALKKARLILGLPLLYFQAYRVFIWSPAWICWLQYGRQVKCTHCSLLLASPLLLSPAC